MGYPEGREEVLNFINDMYSAQPEQNQEAVRLLFHNGYCYYFAHMLKMAFSRGDICLVYPFGHVVWVDTDGTPYDVEGVTISEYEYLVDMDAVPGLKNDFLHLRGVKSPDGIREQVEKLILDAEDKTGVIRASRRVVADTSRKLNLG